MTWTKRANELTVTCDGPSCGERMTDDRVRDTDTEYTQRSKLWAKASRRGWTAQATIHLCHRCSE